MPSIVDNRGRLKNITVEETTGNPSLPDVGTKILSTMGNFKVETTGVAFWDTSKSETVSFDGSSYTVDFAELEPERLQSSKVSIVNDHTVSLTIDSDPNNLLP